MKLKGWSSNSVPVPAQFGFAPVPTYFTATVTVYVSDGSVGAVNVPKPGSIAGLVYGTLMFACPLLVWKRATSAQLGFDTKP